MVIGYPMGKKALDSFNKRLISLLSENGRVPIGRISKRLKTTAPTIRSRMQNLLNIGILKIAGLVDLSKTTDLTIALAGITLESHHQLDEKLAQISKLGQVHWAAVVTGRYDIIVEVVLEEGMLDLYKFLTKELPNVGGIRSSESFVMLKANRKFILLPRGLKNW